MTKDKTKELIMAELETIHSQSPDGLLKPEAVVEFAEDPNTALHYCFNWDNDSAAYQWRLQHARQIIRVAETILPNIDHGKIRAFVSLKDDRYTTSGYRPMVRVLEQSELRDAMIREAYQDMQALIAKYESLKELAEIFVTAMAELQKLVKPARRKRGAVKEKAAIISPVPGGVGPISIACALKKIVKTYKNHFENA